MSSGIAIVGMACRYPDARNPAELWENVLAGRRAFRRVPPQRLRLEDYAGTGPDSVYVKEGAFLTDWEFDRVAFKVAGPSFRAADLTHWLALEVAAAALADAGFPQGAGLPRAATGVLVGNSLTGEFSRSGLLRQRWPFVRRMVGAALAEEGFDAPTAASFLNRLEETFKAPFEPPGEETLAGGLANTIAGRICNHFDLGGGGYLVDGACASSLLAVANACSALTAGDLDVALAGGVDLSLDPFELIGFSRAGAFARDRMRVFDARSAGFLPGEGSGFVVLMRQDEALAQGLRVHATIRGWGISSDGAGGLTRPEPEGQRLAFDRAYRRAGFGPETVSYFEGHGTGTAVGDAAELTALSRARKAADPQAAPAAVGSIKAIFGHTKAAAGVAGLIKAVMATRAGVLPPTVGCDDPHPVITDETPRMLRVLQRAEPWPAGAPARAAASAMGFGGINAHVVIEAEGRGRRHRLGAAERRLDASRQDAELLVLAAPTAAELGARAEELAARCAELSMAELGDLACELAKAAPAGKFRAAVVAATPREAVSRLQALVTDSTPRLDAETGLFVGIASGRPPRIGLLFPGQASPARLGGGAWVRRFEEVEEIYARPEVPRHGDEVATEIAQPAIVAAELAALAALATFGVEAQVAVGHSLGELAALTWAGALEPEAVLRLALARGRAMAGLPAEEGAMVSLACSATEATALLAGLPFVVAGENAPRQTVVSGPLASLETLLTRARERHVATVRLKVSHAFHSPLVEPATAAFAEALGREDVAPLAAGRRVVSTITGEPLGTDEDLAALLIRQITTAVRFTRALERAGDVDLWLEAGPGRVLSGLVAKIRPEVPALALDAGSEQLSGLLAALGAAWVLGAPVDLAELARHRFSRPLAATRRFLANPCEAAPLPGEALAARLADAGTRPTAVAVETPGSEPESELPPLELVRQLVASRAELPPEAVADSGRMLSDLHLNSIAVGQLVVEAARRLGAPPPASPTDFADASVAEVAAALAHLAATHATDEDDLPAAAPPGVDAWVRAFTDHWFERPLPAGRLEVETRFEVLAIADDPWHAAVTAGLGATAETASPGTLVLVPTVLDAAAVDVLLAAGGAVLARRSAPFVMVHRGFGGPGFARALHLERPGGATLVVEIPAEVDAATAAGWLGAEIAAAELTEDVYREAHYDATGRRRMAVHQVLPPAATTTPLPLDSRDVVLVSGGGRGIAAECALRLARETGAALAILGRSHPGENGELQGNLERFAHHGVRFRYQVADVTDGAAVARAVAELERDLGPVTALIHSAGINEPRLVPALDREAVLATLEPKLAGFDHLVAAVDPEGLRLVVAMGSIIGRSGLVGEAHYALANDALARRVERFGAAHPRCRALTTAWSVWSGVGMGERLGTLAALERQGITPISPERGVAALVELLTRPEVRGTVVVAGRCGQPPTVETPAFEPPFLRFLERVRYHVSRVELVVDTELSSEHDPYLADHVFAGERLFPAVLGLEAMAQAAAALLERPIDGGTSPIFEQVTFERPVSVPEDRPLTLRLVALERGPGRVEVALRSAGTAFQLDHFRAVVRFSDGAPELQGELGATRSRSVLAPGELEPARDLYGGVMFHQGRFRRLAGYHRLSATDCAAEIAPAPASGWFGRALPGTLLLGDPAARDAAIHAIQACIPHATVLPVAVARIESGVFGFGVAHSIEAVERHRDGRTMWYDLVVRTAAGAIVERWLGLELRAVEERPAPGAWPLPLLGPHLERRFADFVPFAGLRVGVEAARAGRDRSARQPASDHAVADAVARLAGFDELAAAPRVVRRPDGRPEIVGQPETAIAVSHGPGLVLAVAGHGAVGCDVEPVAVRSVDDWRGLLGTERVALAELLARELGESFDHGATRVWTAAESLKKAGFATDAPLVLESAGRRDGWLLMRSGERLVASVVTRTAGFEAPLAVALLAALVPAASHHYPEIPSP
ncbi:MAG: SDR family NAD(P)-dependent oxidoreductase [Thermoanaerobaculia bacterium]|nr:SDR family NAD(P)-dependent oxidoreductase [Thermoanaerobaculia bacterium]